MNTDEISIIASLLACAIALISAVYARNSRNVAQDANRISLHQGLRPLRLLIYTSMKEYAHYCSTYRTLQCLGDVNGTRDLVQRIESLKWEIDNHGPLDMLDIEDKAVEFQNAGWKLQRVLDRLSVYENKTEDEEFEALEDSMHEMIDWFHEEGKRLKKMFEKYLKHA